MKKIFKSFILSLLIVLAISSSTANAKTRKQIRVGKTNVSITEGKQTTVSIINCKKYRVSISKKIVKVTKNKKSIKIKALKAGKTTITIKASKMRSRKINVKVKHKITESYLRKRIDGCGDKYKNDVTTYPYFDVKNYKRLPLLAREGIQSSWRAMPDYLRDCLAHEKVDISFKVDTDGELYSYTAYDGKGEHPVYIKLAFDTKHNLSGRNDIIHEAVHVYKTWYAECLYGLDVTPKKIKEEYKKNPEKYGWYGATGLDEFYAESISNEVMSKHKFVEDKDLFNELLKYVQVDKMPYSLDISFQRWTNGFDVIIDGQTYTNGRKRRDFAKDMKKIAEDYFTKLYPNDKLVYWYPDEWEAA